MVRIQRGFSNAVLLSSPVYPTKTHDRSLGGNKTASQLAQNCRALLLVIIYSGRIAKTIALSFSFFLVSNFSSKMSELY
jgi:hypothetical protein